MSFNLGLGLIGPDIRPGLDNRHLIIEGHRRSWKVKDGHGWSFPIHWIDISGDKSCVVACRIIMSVPVPFL